MDLSLEKPRGQLVMEINVVCLSTKRHRQDNPLQHWFPCKLKLISEADNTRVMKRSVQCQCRQQSYSKLLARSSFLAGLSARQLLPVSALLVLRLKSPFSFAQLKMKQIAPSTGSALARSGQGECAQMAWIAGHPQAKSCKNNQQRRNCVYEPSFTSHSGMTRKQLSRTIYMQAGMVHWPNKTQSTLQWRENVTKLKPLTSWEYDLCWEYTLQFPTLIIH